MEKDINEVAMGVIINACAGRDKVDKAFVLMSEMKFEEAEEMLAAADEDMLKAHNTQTKMIQAQAAGENTEYSLLFIHAQDTLMTSASEYRIALHMLPVIRALHEQAKTA